MEMILPPRGDESFKEELEKGRVGLRRVMECLANIDVKSAEASYPQDKAMVKDLIEKVRHNYYSDAS